MMKDISDFGELKKQIEMVKKLRSVEERKAEYEKQFLPLEAATISARNLRLRRDDEIEFITVGKKFDAPSVT
jgi:hypothetical protein